MYLTRDVCSRSEIFWSALTNKDRSHKQFGAQRSMSGETILVLLKAKLDVVSSNQTTLAN